MRKRVIREQFARLALEHDEALDLARGAVLIAAEDDDGVDVDAVLENLARIGAAAAERLGNAKRADHTMLVLADYLHRDIGLSGNKNSYYDPKNSFLHEVLARKKGIPISLAVIYITVGRAAGLDLVGVAFPAHFLIGVYSGGIDRSRLPDWFVDPFEPMRLMSVEDCRTLFKSLGGTDAAFRAEHLATATHRQILARMLTNLKMIYARTGETEKSIAAIDRILLLNPNARAEFRDRGALHMQLDLYSLALDDFTRYLAEEPAPEERATIEQAITELKSRIAMLH
ncbi:MAG: SirB1 family protein [Myxococcota bacterium]